MKKRNRKRINILVPIHYPYKKLMQLLYRGFWDDSGCYIWHAKGDKNGYGMTTFTENKVKKSWRVSRLIWTLANGEIPKGMLTCHHCDEPRCFNIDHLFLGTPSDNSRDREIKQRSGSNYEPGEKNHQSKLTESDVLLIRKLYSEGIYAKELAKIFNLSPNHIVRLATKARWGHI